MKKIILKIEGMTCSACSSSLEKYLLKQEGIDDALVNLVMSSASITYEDNITMDDLNRFVSEAGFKSLGLYNENEDKDNNRTKYFVTCIISSIHFYVTHDTFTCNTILTYDKLSSKLFSMSIYI